MRPPLFEMILSQLSFAVIGFSSLYTAYLFHTSTDKGLLKRLVVRLFLTLGYSALLIGGWWLLWDLNVIDEQQPIWIRLMAQIPLCWVIFRFLWFVKRDR